jgi:integrase
LSIKRALGKRLDSAQYILIQLDKFIASKQAVDLTLEIFTAWTSSIAHLAASTRRQRMRTVYRLCLFRRRDEPTCLLPDPNQFPALPPRPKPYIFSKDDITRILLTTDTLEPSIHSPLQPQVARIAIVLLYTAGFRRGELVRFTLSDYDSAKRVLFVHETKFYKSRLVPLSDDAVREIDRYMHDRLKRGFPHDDGSSLLIHRHSVLTGYSGPGLGGLLRKLFRKAEIRNRSGRSPRVHDLRFTFAAHALLRWYRAGIDVQSRLPSLSTYMGHASIQSTQYYLTFLDAIAQTAGARFEKHCSRFLPTTLSSGE